MRANIRVAVAVLIAAGACTGSASTAFAQQAGPAQLTRPYRSLFGGAAGMEAPQMLDLSISFAEAYDANALGAATGVTTGPSPLLAGGFFSALSTELRYSVRGRRAAFSANAGSSVRYFTAVNEVVALGQYVGAGVSLPFGKGTTFATNHAVTYMPSHLQGLFASTMEPALGDTIEPAVDLAVNNRESYTYEGAARFSHELSRRVMLSLHSFYRNTASVGVADAPLSDFWSFDAGGAVTYEASRDMRLRLGYAYRGAHYSLNRRPVQHDINIGIDYDRALSRSRRTRLGFSLGSAVFEGPLGITQSIASVKQFRAVGNVRLSHQMGRTWSTSAAFRRSAQFVETLAAPAFLDAVTLNANGFLNRRTDVSASASYSTGTLIGAIDSDLETYTGNVRFRVGLSNKLAAFAEYLYYYYDVGEGAQRTSGIPTVVTRNGIRVGITLWTPIIRK